MQRRSTPSRQAKPVDDRVLDLARQDLARSGLDLSELEGVDIVADASTVIPSAPAVAALMFRYWDPGKGAWIAPGEFCRVRLLEQPPAAFPVKGARYLQPYASLNGVYIPMAKALDWPAALKDASIPITITEGEKKAWAMAKCEVHCLGLGGITMFSAEKKGQPMLPFFDHVEWRGREVVVCFDTDTVGGLKPQVARAAERLMDRLLALGATPSLAVLPAGRNGEKMGLDDYYVKYGREAVLEELNSATRGKQAMQMLALASRYTYLTELGRIFDHEMGVIQPREHFILQTQNIKIDRWVRRIKMNGSIPQPGWHLVPMSGGEAFINWEARPEAPSVDYVPGQGPRLEDGKVNQWTGWACGEAEKGDISEFFWALDNLFADEPSAREFAEHWFFYPLKHPGTKLYTAALIVSPEEGIGKTFISEMLAKHVYGLVRPYQNATVVQEGALGGEYNSFIVHRQFVLGDDIAGNDAYEHLARIKSLVTDEFLTVKQKYVPEYTVRNIANFSLTANNPITFKLSDEDRRFFIHAPRRAKKDRERYNRLRIAFEGGLGRAVLWHARHVYDEKGFDPRQKAPETQARAEMITLGSSDLEDWCRSVKERAELFTRDFATAKELYALFQVETQGVCGNVSPQAFGRAMAKQGFGQWQGGKTFRYGENGKDVARAWFLRRPDVWRGADPGQLSAELKRVKEFRPESRPQLAPVPSAKERKKKF